jgi:hypothetical protein
MKITLVVLFVFLFGHILPEESKAGDQPIVVDSDSIMFFAVSQEEYNAMKDDEKWQADEVLSDCYASFSQVKGLFSKSCVNVFIYANNEATFMITPENPSPFHRSMKEHLVGVVLFHPGEKPLIEYGVFSLSDILVLVRGYHEEWLGETDFMEGIATQIAELKRTDYGGRFMEGKSDKDLETVILFLQDPGEYFQSVKKIANLFSYIEVYSRYLGEEKKSGCGFNFFLREHFDVVDETRAEILIYLLMSADGEYVEEAADWFTVAFNSYPDVFVRILRDKDWKRIVDRLDAGNWNEFKSGLAKLGNSKFEKVFREYALAPRDRNGNRVVER